MPSSSGYGTIAKIPFNCFVCGSALSNGAFQCFHVTRFSSNPVCQHLFCSECSRSHAERFRHNTSRLVSLDHVTADATFACPFDGCGEEMSASHYDAHVEACLFKTLSCPRCNNLFTSNALIPHLVGEHWFVHHQLTYGNPIGSEISKNGGCILSGGDEAFIFFFEHGELYYFWVGSSPAPADFQLMVNIATQAQQNCGVFSKPALARSRGAVRLLNLDLDHVINQNNILRITIMIS
ncbi:hypothetical protein PAHAL_J038600 [Panicum hallii]|uniref:RING-type E3 ubiquitin transferase n=1 Tax=Panicum hallii TaxID=206008 RepID=A0A2T7A9U9_9POAL|nr:hypothetical protein PAHAL_J038600 [Panicum hallii]